jgi:hypothetical protein
MRLDGAVYVLARPKAPSMPTRRAFVIAGCTFAAGMVVGGACGYSAGVVAGAETPPGEPAAVELPKSGDAELDALRALAVQAPIDELMRYAHPFLEIVNDTYPKDAVLWQGVDRIADALLEGYQARGRRLLGRVVAQLIEGGDAQLASPRMNKVAPLRRIQ